MDLTKMKAADLRLKIYKEMVGKTILDRYELLELIGFGGMGAVFKGLQRAINRTVAIKVLPRLDPLTAARFHREAKLASRLTHSNTITVFDFGQTPDNYLFLVMEYLEGRSLRSVLKECGALHPARAIHMACQICRSLSEAHSQGIVHRDIKPDNIFLINRDDDPDFVKVLDFGIAKVLAGDDTDTELTAAGRIVGTPRYMAPEQVMSLPVDHRADIYSLGVIMYQMLTGSPPFDDASTPMLMMKHAHETPQEFSQRVNSQELLQLIPPGLEAIVMKALTKRQEDRQQSVDALRNELELIRASLGGEQPSYVSGVYSPPIRPEITPNHSGSMQAVSGELVQDPSDPSMPSFPSAPSEPSVEVGAMGTVVANAAQQQASSTALARTTNVHDTFPPGASERTGTRTGLIAVVAVFAIIMLLGLAGGVGAIVAGTYFGTADGDDSSKSTAAVVNNDGTDEDVPPTMAKDAKRITVQSTPTQASIYEGDELVGQTPMVIEVPADADRVAYVLKKDGYSSMSRQFVVAKLPEVGLHWNAKLEPVGGDETSEADSKPEETKETAKAGANNTTTNAARRNPRKRIGRVVRTNPPKKEDNEPKKEETTPAEKKEPRKPKIEVLGADDAPKKPKVDALD